MKEWIKLGIVRNLFRDFDQKKVLINPDKMVYHTLVTGTTGVGKTNSIKVIVSEMVKNHIPFLVIEPAKNEYCELIGLSHIENRVRYFQAGKSRDGKSNDTCLRINPFIFPQSSNISINEHIDKICALFNSAFPMYDAMPHILEEAIIKAYLNCGWDMETSCNIRNVITFPTLLDVAELIPNIVKQAGYEYEVKSTYIGALTTRLKSLTRGSLGFTFLATPDQETPERELFDESCIVNLSSIGSSEKKSILMGLILIRLCEHSMTHQQTEYDHLKHLMILEEAHHLLKKVSKDQSQESSNPQGQAVEYLSNMLAEMRSYGQGMLIVDQSPSALDESVLRNTNIKISFRAPFEEDRKIIGGALNLDDKQTKALASLENHTALVKQNNWLEPILCHFDKFDKSQLATNQSDELSPNKDRIALTEVLFLLLHERFPKNAKIPEMEISNKELGNWVEETIPELDNKKLILEYLITHVADLELEQMIPVLFALPLIKSIVEEAFNLLQTPESIINNLQAKVKICTWFDDPLILQEIAHTLLMACRTQKAETVDDVLLGTKEKEEI